MAGTVVIDLTAKDNVSATLSKVDGQAQKLNKTFVDSKGKLRNASGQFVKMSKTAGTARQSFKLLGTTFSTYLAPLVAFGAAVKGVTDSLAVFSQRQKDTAALANGIKGMTTDGKAALDSLKQSADELGKATLFDEEDFTKGFKLLTSFKTIGVSSYEDVAKTAADMATVLDSDVNSTLLQVAKALEAPDVGLTALQRSGTRFTDSQKQQVKAMVAANKTAEAQAFILAELKRQYGGAADAAATGLAGAMDTLGEVTRDAMEGLGALIEPGVAAGINLISQGIEKLTSFFQGLADAVLPKAQAAFEPIFEVMKNIFERVDLEGAANLIGNVLVIGAQTFFDALSLITPVIAKIAEGLFFLLENSPFGFMVKGIMKVAEHLGLTKPLVNQFGAAADGAKKSFQDMPPAIDAAVDAQKRKIESLKESVGLVEKEKQNVTAQQAAYENSLNVANARLDAEAAINQMQNQGLQIAYEQAGSAQQRANIAKQIFDNEINGARIAYQQTLNSIQAEQQRLQFRREAAVIEGQMIQARGELAAAEAAANGANQKQVDAILAKTRQAVDVQRQNVQLIDGQIRAQKQVAEFQKQAAKAAFDAKTMTAEQSLKQKLVSDEIGMSKREADAMAGRLGDGARSSVDLANGTGRVASNAQNSAHMFIQVAENAASAAAQINAAAAAQERLNRARAAKARSSKGGGKVKKQAKGGFNKGAFQPFAQGGVVNGPTLGLIGEGGEPEYIIPQSKAAGFAANFLSGKRGAGAIPGFAEGGVAVPSSASVSIQTGPVTQMDGKNFVTTQEMSRAVQSGVQQTLDIIRRDNGVRSQLGLS